MPKQSPSGGWDSFDNGIASVAVIQRFVRYTVWPVDADYLPEMTPAVCVQSIQYPLGEFSRGRALVTNYNRRIRSCRLAEDDMPTVCGRRQ